MNLISTDLPAHIILITSKSPAESEESPKYPSAGNCESHSLHRVPRLRVSFRQHENMILPPVIQHIEVCVQAINNN